MNTYQNPNTKNKKKHWIILAVCILAAIAVIVFFVRPNKRNWEKLSGNKLIQITTDLSIADGIFISNGLGYEVQDSTKATVYAGIFNKYACTKQDYDSSMAWYSLNRPDAAEVIWDKVMDNIQKKQTELDTIISREKAEKEILLKQQDLSDKVNINLLATNRKRELIEIGPRMVNQIYATPNNIQVTPNTSFLLNVSVLGQIKKGYNPITIAVVANDYNSIVTYKEMQIKKTGMNKLKLTVPKDYLDGTLSLKAYITCQNSSDKKLAPLTFMIDSISLIKLPMKKVAKQNKSEETSIETDQEKTKQSNTKITPIQIQIDEKELQKKLQSLSEEKK
ncbi:MAG: DUF4296 domain-containing protein [Porphyromonadaceae bacterium]|nr:DUF4296 domain-containing protein [Porphyromonadaceae bacterium]